MVDHATHATSNNDGQVVRLPTMNNGRNNAPTKSVISQLSSEEVEKAIESGSDESTPAN